jgi:hypothetical protein
LAAALVALVVARDVVLLSGSFIHRAYTLGWQVCGRFHYLLCQLELGISFLMFLTPKAIWLFQFHRPFKIECPYKTGKQELECTSLAHNGFNLVACSWKRQLSSLFFLVANSRHVSENVIISREGVLMFV